MNHLKMLFFVSSILVSASVWAESGGDRVIERMEGLRDKAEATLMKAEQAPEGERHVHMAEHMKMLGDIMSKHDKIVDDVLRQMQREHKLMLSENHQ